MFLLIGLGNPQKKYQFTRHNAGYLFVDWLFRYPEFVGGSRPVKTKGVPMNQSGRFVAKALRKRGLTTKELILIHDDLDLELGEFRLQFGRGDAGHNGVKSVIEALGTKDFWRLRIGIGRPGDSAGEEKYVLGRFSKEELDVLESLVPNVLQKISTTKI
jgi:PTH1 family peptidyl-tRNA hydrolase